MITRIWHGYTTFENADVYETLLKLEIDARCWMLDARYGIRD